MKAAWLLLLCTASAQASQPLPQAEAAAWLQKMADAASRMTYEGVFVVRQGDNMQTLSVSNRPSGHGHESRLMALDGKLREVRCSQTGAVTLVSDGSQVHMSPPFPRPPAGQSAASGQLV
jgi:negative regulator of sigma E activity